MAEKGGSADEDKPLTMSSLSDALPEHEEEGHSGYIESLPPKIKKRVEALQEMQAQYDEIVSKFLEEKAALEAKYQKMYEPLYSKRYDIVNGIIDVEDAEEEKTGQDSKQETTSEEKGVPEFWYTAMTNNDVLSPKFTERDEDALKFLTDIKCFPLNERKGFRLEFFFNENPYFKNTVLKKTYYMEDENVLILDRATGTKIDWFPGKNLTETHVMRRRKPRTKSGQTVMTVVPCPSFFNFFSPPYIPDGAGEVLVERVEDLLDEDYEVGATIRDKIIPRAVSWFTGEAIETDDEYEDEDEDDEDENGDDDEDEDEDVEDKENEEKDHGHQKRGFKAKPKISLYRASN